MIQSSVSAEVLQLQRLEHDHAPELFHLIDDNRAALGKFWWERATQSVADSDRFIAAAHQAEEDDHRVTRGIFAGSELIGVGDIHSIDRKLSRAALGYWVDRRSSGHGYATRAAGQLVQLAFRHLQLSSVHVSVRESNIGSRRVAEKNGFVHVATDYQPTWQEVTDDTTPIYHYERHNDA